jgi:IclR family mhp operon transcriptional activator
MAGKSKQELQSLKRGLRAITLINQAGSITIAQLAKALAVPRTSAERVLMTMAQEGYLERDPVSKIFTLTQQVERLSSGYSQDLHMIKVAQPLLTATTREIGWPLCIATPLGENMTIRFTTDHETSLNLNRRHVGTSGPIALVASGLVFLAYLEDAQLKSFVEFLKGCAKPQQDLVHDPERLAFVLGQVRRNGYGFGLDYGRERSVALPIRAHGVIKGALFMPFMKRVLTNEAVVERFVPRLQAVAAEIERQAFGQSS